MQSAQQQVLPPVRLPGACGRAPLRPAALAGRPRAAAVAGGRVGPAAGGGPRSPQPQALHPDGCGPGGGGSAGRRARPAIGGARDRRRLPGQHVLRWRARVAQLARGVHPRAAGPQPPGGRARARADVPAGAGQRRDGRGAPQGGARGEGHTAALHVGRLLAAQQPLAPGWLAPPRGAAWVQHGRARPAGGGGAVGRVHPGGQTLHQRPARAGHRRRAHPPGRQHQLGRRAGAPRHRSRPPPRGRPELPATRAAPGG
mmetsp:Transcript_42603/g.107707  ORF Transcript_42603/g.107707 Transcript_42603/m.107707 type:complete len:257 (+) Transcript_42603:1665-2435(+)